MADEAVNSNVNFDLAQRLLLMLLTQNVRARRQLNPVAAKDVLVDHEAQVELNVRLVGLARHHTLGRRHARLNGSLGGGHALVLRHCDAEEGPLVVSVEAVNALLHLQLDAKHGLRDFGVSVGLLDLLVQLVVELGAQVRREPLGRRHVKVGQKAVHVAHDTVALLGNAVHAHDVHLADASTWHALHRRSNVVLHLNLLEDDGLLLRVDRRQRRARPDTMRLVAHVLQVLDERRLGHHGIAAVPLQRRQAVARLPLQQRLRLRLCVRHLLLSLCCSALQLNTLQTLTKLRRFRPHFCRAPNRFGLAQFYFVRKPTFFPSLFPGLSGSGGYCAM
eukprot:m.163927 g.163927  ORF g.163927 m.163927 type:complete len:333 (+) comp17121_c0_seq2:3245-4243(+)